MVAFTALSQNLFVADYFGGVYEFKPDGTRTTFASGLDYPTGLAFNRAGDLFVADQGSGNIYEYKPDGTRSTFATGLNGPLALAFDTEGDLFASDGPLGGNLYEFTPGGVKITNSVDVLAGAFGMAFNSAGNLFLASLGNSTIYEYRPDGTLSNYSSAVYAPFGVVFNGAGNMYVSDFGSTIFKFTPDGVESTYATNLNTPAGLAFDSSGNLFVALSTGSVIEIKPDGTQSTFASGFPTNNGFNPTASPRTLAFQPVPELVGLVTNRAFQITVSMPSPYYSTVVQASTDLVNWTNIYTNTPPFTFSDTVVTTSPRFYRAVVGP